MMAEQSDWDAEEDVFTPVIHPGILLALSLYHFANPLGRAGEDMRDLGAEVTLFCAIMRQVRTIFDRPKPFRISTTAIQDVHDVLKRGKAIFNKIEALLSGLQNDQDDSVDIFTRVGQTFRKTKVLMWKESLRSCTAMVQVMLTTMDFAESIASSGRSTPASINDNEQLRDLMQSLLLAQQNTNARLSKLEDQSILDEMQPSPSTATTSPGLLDVDGNALRGSSRSRHARNRSSRITQEIANSEVAELLSGRSQRTSVLLNSKIPLENIPESQRNTCSSDLLQNWTDQLDPAPPYALSLHLDYATTLPEFQALRILGETEDSPSKSTSAGVSPKVKTTTLFESSDQTVPVKPLLNRQHPISRSSPDHVPLTSSFPPLRTVSPARRPTPFDPDREKRNFVQDIAKQQGEQEAVDEVSQISMVGKARESTKLGKPTTSKLVQVIFDSQTILVDYSQCSTSDDIFIKILEELIPHAKQFWGKYRIWVLEPIKLTRHNWESLAKVELDRVGNVVIVKPDGEVPSTFESQEVVRLIYGSSEGAKSLQKGMSPGAGFEKSPSSLKSSPKFEFPRAAPLSNVSVGRLPVSSRTGTVQFNQGPASIDMTTTFRVSIEDPCWKVLPVALRRYNIQADWRTYALYIVWDDQERCIGLEEMPLKIFKELVREGKSPTFMLRKLANVAPTTTLPASGSGTSSLPGGVL